MELHGTTIVCVRDGARVAMGGDGQVSFGQTVMKSNARKIRRMHDGKILAGFAGSTADAFTLLERFDSKLSSYGGQLMRAAVELAKDWRTDRYLRRLEAMLAVADAQLTLILSGTGDIVEPEDGVCAIGSGGPMALAAARALKAETELPPDQVVRRALEIAADICIYTNRQISVESLES